MVKNRVNDPVIGSPMNFTELWGGADLGMHLCAPMKAIQQLEGKERGHLPLIGLENFSWFPGTYLDSQKELPWDQETERPFFSTDCLDQTSWKLRGKMCEVSGRPLRGEQVSIHRESDKALSWWHVFTACSPISRSPVMIQNVIASGVPVRTLGGHDLK